MAWIQSLAFVTQSAHFFAGWAITMSLALWMPWYVAAAAFSLLWVIPKELVFDKAGWGEAHGSCDWIDAAFYWAGQAVACALVAICELPR